MKGSRIALAFACAAAACAAEANDGDFVDTFGTHGREQFGFSPNLGTAVSTAAFTDVVALPNGKLLVSASPADPNAEFGLVQLNANGTLDTNFGTQGQTIAGFAGAGDIAASMKRQPDGRIVLCGTAGGDSSAGGSDFGVMRFTAAGNLDPTFSGDGKATVAFDLGAVGRRDDVGTRCALQPDGKIVIVGTATTDTGSRFGVARLNTDGSRDTTFNGSGTATIDFGPSLTNDIPFGVAFFSNGDIIVVGAGISSADGSFAVAARLDASGQLVDAFANSGILVMSDPIGSYQSAEAINVAVLPDDSFVLVAGVALLPAKTNLDWGIFKFTSSGSLDHDFGLDGATIVPWDLGGTFQDIPDSIVVDGSNRLLVAGFGEADGIPFSGELARFMPDGSLDPSFGVDGKIILSTTPPPAPAAGDQLSSIAFTPDNAIVVGSIATSADSPTGTYIGLAKLSVDSIFADGFDP
jgi:uncharacterized delta-60 repeat protein